MRKPTAYELEVARAYVGAMPERDGGRLASLETADGQWRLWGWMSDDAMIDHMAESFRDDKWHFGYTVCMMDNDLLRFPQPPADLLRRDGQLHCWPRTYEKC